MSAGPLRCLVTGAEGFVGSWLLEYLLEQGHAVYAGFFGASSLPHSKAAGFHAGELDVSNAAAVDDFVRLAQPDRVFHLAAQSLPVISWQRPGPTLQVNVLGTIHLLEACRKHAPNAVFVSIGSSSEYASNPRNTPVCEDAPRSPSTPYALSKWCADECARLYHKQFNMNIVRARPFFVIGPRKTGDVCSDFARGTVAMERGEASCISVGNLDVVRDFLDIRDAVRALETIAARGTPGCVYNICSGQGRKIAEILDGYATFASVPLHWQQTSALMRPMDDMVRVGDPGRLLALGWKPNVPWEQTLKDILEYWRQA